MEHNGALLYSKKKLGRFPAEGEVLEIVKQLKAGKTLEEAQEFAAQSAPRVPSFFEWLNGFLKRAKR